MNFNGLGTFIIKALSFVLAVVVVLVTLLALVTQWMGSIASAIIVAGLVYGIAVLLTRSWAGGIGARYLTVPAAGIAAYVGAEYASVHGGFAGAFYGALITAILGAVGIGATYLVAIFVFPRIWKPRSK